MRLSFYTVDPEYCDYLRAYDPKVPHTMEKKSSRPFVGIIFSINNCNYYAPLTSPKEKHIRMKNQVDFMKINGGKWGAINYNNMIPVNDFSVKKIDMEIHENDLPDVIVYKSLLINQLSWCNAHRTEILKQAEKLYRLITEKTAWDSLMSRCCDFENDEKLCADYKNHFE